MLLITKGRSININKPLVGKVTRNPLNDGGNNMLICDTRLDNTSVENFFGLLFSVEHDLEMNQYLFNNIPVLAGIKSLDHLFEGDIVSVDAEGNLRTLYRVNSFHNILFVTERCNSNCLMCSQPPRDRDDITGLFEINKQLIALIPKDCKELCITGGEPTLMGERFFETLEQLKEQLPHTEIHVLSNGRSFAWPGMAARLADVGYKKMMIGIPLYADYYQVHDYIVQAKDAFYQTVSGIHNLAAYGQRIEIRVVLHRQSIPRLYRLAKYIYKNMPFVEHVAFMGLELIGYTPHNLEKLWIDPYEYNVELTEAVKFLAGQGLHVSIYNSQLCVLPFELWKYARKSISDWKNDYLPECKQCSKLETCGGFFTWNLKKPSVHTKPFIE